VRAAAPEDCELCPCEQLARRVPWRHALKLFPRSSPRALPPPHSWCNLRFLSPVLFIDEAELIADRKHTPIATALLAQLGMTCVPKVVDSHRLSRERVDLYYKRQLEYTAAQPRPSEAAEAGDGQEAPAADREAAELPDCSICLSTMSGSMLLPCGHTSTCHDCAVHLCTLVHINAHRCPICRCHIEKVLQADCPVKSSLRVLDVCGMVM
jgi:hypothetical protein